VTDRAGQVASYISAAATGRRWQRNVVTMLLCAVIQGMIDWALFFGISERLLRHFGGDISPFSVPLFRWIIGVMAIVGIPAALYGAVLGYAWAYERDVSLMFALVAALAVGIAAIAVYVWLFPEHDPLDVPMHLMEITKIGTFVVSGMVFWAAAQYWRHATLRAG